MFHDACVGLDVKPSPEIKPHGPPSSHLPQIQLIPSPLEMKSTSHTDLALTDREADEPEPSGVLTPAEKCLAETTPNSDNAPFQLSSPETSGYRSIKRFPSSPSEVLDDTPETCPTADPMDRKVTERGPGRDSKDLTHLANHDTVSRSTQTALDPGWTNERYGNEGILVRVPISILNTTVSRLAHRYFHFLPSRVAWKDKRTLPQANLLNCDGRILSSRQCSQSPALRYTSMASRTSSAEGYAGDNQWEEEG